MAQTFLSLDAIDSTMTSDPAGSNNSGEHTLLSLYMSRPWLQVSNHN